MLSASGSMMGCNSDTPGQWEGAGGKSLCEEPAQLECEQVRALQNHGVVCTVALQNSQPQQPCPKDKMNHTDLKPNCVNK